MRLTVYGYISPLFPIRDFLTTVYTDGEYFYFAHFEKSRIAAFQLLDATTNLVEKRNQVGREPGDSHYYFYAGEENQTIEGEYPDIFGYFLELSNSPNLNEFAKLSIAIFLSLEGLKYRTIRAINNVDQNAGHMVKLNFDDGSYTDLSPDELDHKLPVIFAGYKILFETSGGEVRYKDVICVHADYLYFSGYKCEISHFIAVSDHHLNILKRFLQEIGQSGLKEMLLDNDFLYLLNLQDKLEDILPARPDTSRENKLVRSRYRYEHLLSRHAALMDEEKENPSDFPVESDVELKKSLKQLKYNLSE